MKKTILLIAVLFFGAFSASAQYNQYNGFTSYTGAPIIEGMKYKQLKNIYDSRDYVKQYGDHYSLGWAGVGSALIPGLGQCIDGEWGRGVLIFLGDVALDIATGTQRSTVRDDDGIKYVHRTPMYWIFYAAELGYRVWNVLDALKVAKVKNMYLQDLARQRSALDFDMSPYFTCAPMGESKLQPVAGMSLRVSF